MVRRLRGFEGFGMMPGGKSVMFCFGEDMEMFTLDEACRICMYTVTLQETNISHHGKFGKSSLNLTFQGIY